MAELELWFQLEQGLVLYKTVCRHAGNEVVTQPDQDPVPFQWSRAGIKAHVWLFLQWAIWANGRDYDPAVEPPAVPVEKDTLARSVRDLLEKELKWRDRVLGELKIIDLIGARMRNRQPELYLNTATLVPTNIMVFVAGQRVNDSEELANLAREITEQWEGLRPGSIAEPGSRKEDLLRNILADPEEKGRLHDLASASLEIPTSALPAEIGVVVGFAQRVQLAVAFRHCLDRAIFDMALLVQEAPWEPKDVLQALRLVTESLNRFTDTSNLISDQATTWPAFHTLAEAAIEEVNSQGKQAVAVVKSAIGTNEQSRSEKEAALVSVGKIAEGIRRSLDECKRTLLELSHEARERFLLITKGGDPLRGGER